MRLHDLTGGIVTEVPLAASASNAANAVVGLLTNPFPNEKALVTAAEIVPIEAITGDNTNTSNYNLQLADGTEIGNLDYPTSVNGVKGVAQSLTLTGTAAQKTIAAGGCVCVLQEKIGTQPARAAGTKLRVTWRGYGP